VRRDGSQFVFGFLLIPSYIYLLNVPDMVQCLFESLRTHEHVPLDLNSVSKDGAVQNKRENDLTVQCTRCINT
jgi:hypothetical protein